MKLYVLDMGWQGSSVVIAENKTQALTFMKKAFRFKQHCDYRTKDADEEYHLFSEVDEESIEEVEIKNGISAVFAGDYEFTHDDYESNIVDLNEVDVIL